MKRLARYLMGVLPYFVAEAIQIVFVSIAMFGYSFIMEFNAGYELLRDYQDEVAYFISVLGVAICGVVFFFWYQFEIHGEERGNLKQVFQVKNMILFALLGIGIQLFMTGIMRLVRPYFTDTFENYGQTMENLTSGNTFIVILLLVVIAPITEELIFRGVILLKTRREIVFLGANILQSILFGIYHMNIVQGIYAALIGFILGIIVKRYQTIVAPVLLHMLINASSLLTVFFPAGTLSYLIMTIMGGILVIITLYVINPLRKADIITDTMK